MSIMARFAVGQKATLPVLRRTARQASQDRLPSDAPLLLRDGQTTFRRDQCRRTIIEAGSARELTLADFNGNVTKVKTPRAPHSGWYTSQPTIATGAGCPATLRATSLNCATQRSIGT
jgi:hypothetical protein